MARLWITCILSFLAFHRICNVKSKVYNLIFGISSNIPAPVDNLYILVFGLEANMHRKK